MIFIVLISFAAVDFYGLSEIKCIYLEDINITFLHDTNSFLLVTSKHYPQDDVLKHRDLTRKCETNFHTHTSQ